MLMCSGDGNYGGCIPAVLIIETYVRGPRGRLTPIWISEYFSEGKIDASGAQG
jgi:hypothetical protein